jgi:hypothetical protein
MVLGIGRDLRMRNHFAGISISCRTFYKSALQLTNLPETGSKPSRKVARWTIRDSLRLESYMKYETSVRLRSVSAALSNRRPERRRIYSPGRSPVLSPAMTNPCGMRGGPGSAPKDVAVPPSPSAGRPAGDEMPIAGISSTIVF